MTVDAVEQRASSPSRPAATTGNVESVARPATTAYPDAGSVAGHDHQRQRRRLRSSVPATPPAATTVTRHDRHHRPSASTATPTRRRRWQHRLHGDRSPAPALSTVTVNLSTTAHRSPSRPAQQPASRAALHRATDVIRRRQQRLSATISQRQRRQLREPGGQRRAGHHRHHRHAIDTTTVSLSATPSVAEGGSITLHRHRSPARPTPR